MNTKDASKVFSDIQSRVDEMTFQTLPAEDTERVRAAIDDTAAQMVRRLYEAGEIAPGLVSGSISLGKNVELDVLCILPYLDWVEWYGKYTVRHKGKMMGTVEYRGPAQQGNEKAYYFGAETLFTPAAPHRTIEIIFNFDIAAKSNEVEKRRIQNGKSTI